MSLLVWAVIGNLLAVVAVVFERVGSEVIARRQEEHMSSVMRTANPGMSDADFEEKIAAERIKIRASKRKWDDRAKWLVAAVLLLSSSLLAGDAIMNEEKQKNVVTKEQLESRLSALVVNQGVMSTRVKKLEDTVFGPSDDRTGPLFSRSAKAQAKEIEQLKAAIGDFDRRIKTIQKELTELRAQLKQRTVPAQKGTGQKHSDLMEGIVAGMGGAVPADVVVDPYGRMVVSESVDLVTQLTTLEERVVRLEAPGDSKQEVARY